MTASGTNQRSTGARLLRMFLFAIAGFLVFAVLTILIAMGIALLVPMTASTQLVVVYMVAPMAGLAGALMGLWRGSR